MKIETAIRKLRCEQERNTTNSVDTAYTMAISALEKQKELQENCRGKCSECKYSGVRCANDLLIDGLEGI